MEKRIDSQSPISNANSSVGLVRVAVPRGSGGAVGQRGFALLLVFAMAAIVAVTLYMQLPRVAFEAQRDRESMLIQRGEQYQRAIELFVRKNNRYPARIEDLERNQDMRYLRRRYKDPLTGTDEWRLIHINAGGELEDSLVEKPKTGGNPETASTTATGIDEDENVAENVALARQRTGDQTAANAEFLGGNRANAGPVPGSPQSPGNPLDDGLVPVVDASGNVIQRTQTEAQAQAAQRGVAAAGQTADPGAPPDPNNPTNPERTSAVRLGPGGIPIIENPSAAAAAGGGTTPAGVPGAAGGTQGQGSAEELLKSLLTREVPGGLAAIQQRRGVQAAAGSGQGLGAGIAGVASKYEMKGILVFNEQESIHKWEFVYDARSASASSGAASQSGARGSQGVYAGPGSGFGNTGPGGSTGNQNRPPRGSGPPQGGFGPGGTSPGGLSPGGNLQSPGTFGRPSPGRRP